MIRIGKIIIILRYRIIDQHSQIIIGAQMDIQIDREKIVNKFKRNNHYLNKNSLTLLEDYLKAINNPNKKLDQIIKQINEMVIMEKQPFNESTVKLAIDLLNHTSETGQSFSSYQKYIQNLKNWMIFYLSPYEGGQRFLVDQPDPELFKFYPEDFVEVNQNRFKSIRDLNGHRLKSAQGYIFIGVLYEKFVGEKTKLMLQNQINQVQLVFPQQFQLTCFLIPGCTYIAEGEFRSKDLQLIVKKLDLPMGKEKHRQKNFQLKLKIVCDNISYSKDGLDFSQEDFKAYDMIYNKQGSIKRPVLVFGNVKINKFEASKIRNIIQLYPERILCLIIMMAQEDHEEIDLKKSISETIPIYIIPHINSEGPRIIPKPPILKNDFNVKVLTNPAKLSIEGKTCVFMNFPVIKNLYSRNLAGRQKIVTSYSQSRVKMASEILFSQGTIALVNKFFWKQSDYFNISCEDILFLADKASNQQFCQNSKTGMLTNVGNFERDRQFVFFLPHYKKMIELCDNKDQ